MITRFFMVGGLLLLIGFPAAGAIRIKEIARIDGVRSTPLVGYGLVVGLAGTGDSARSGVTTQSVRNALSRFGIEVPQEEISSRNVAAVTVTGAIPPFAGAGDRVGVNVSSLGDARSLAGGTLLLTPLAAANGEVYALAQGAVSVGGFSYDMNGNMVQKNHPTAGRVPDGAVVERPIPLQLTENGELVVVLNSPDFTTVARVRDVINKRFGEDLAVVESPARVRVRAGAQPMQMIAQIEGLMVEPDTVARVVINERTGTVVAGGNVVLGDVTVAHGDLKVAITTDYHVSQPSLLVGDIGRGIRTAVVPDTTIEVEEEEAQAVQLQSGATIAELVAALRALQTSTRDVISIMQSIKTAGALHAELVVE